VGILFKPGEVLPILKFDSLNFGGETVSVLDSEKLDWAGFADETRSKNCHDAVYLCQHLPKPMDRFSIVSSMSLAEPLCKRIVQLEGDGIGHLLGHRPNRHFEIELVQCLDRCLVKICHRSNAYYLALLSSTSSRSSIYIGEFATIEYISIER
jgi:hypothetical protein